MSSSREYDIVLLGATGYTGKCTAEYITEHLPINIKWAVAGRSASKLEVLVQELNSLNNDRPLPAVEAVDLSLNELTTLAKRTRIMLNCVGPYHLFSIPVVEACAKNGTHYFDVTGETPFVKEVIDKFDSTAKQTGAIIIPEVGIDSTPSDILAYSMVSLLREKYNVGTKDIIASVHAFTKLGPSGGTASTVLTLIASFGLLNLQKLTSPFILSTLNPKPTPRIPPLTNLTGVRTTPELGTMTTHLLAACNVCIVHRSSSENQALYGPNFQYAEYTRARNPLTGFLSHLAITLGMLAVAFPPTRWVVKKLLPQSGGGPDREAAKSERFELRAVATADQTGVEGGEAKRAYGTFAFQGAMYWYTGVMLAQAAMVILQDEEGWKKRLGGGVFTPARLGDAYTENLRKAGCTVETKLMDE